jgi:hypothetical protein
LVTQNVWRYAVGVTLTDVVISGFEYFLTVTN